MPMGRLYHFKLRNFSRKQMLNCGPNKVSLQKRARQRTNSCNIQQLIGYKTYGGLLHFTCTNFRAYRANNK